MLRQCTRLARFGRVCTNVPFVFRTVLPSSQPALWHSAASAWSRSFANDTKPVANDHQPPVCEKTIEATSPSSTETVVDPQAERKRKILELEVEVLRQEGRKVPADMKSDHWEHLLGLGSKSARSKYYTFLWTIEKKRENEKLRRLQRREDGAVLRAERQREHAEAEHIVYSLSGCTYLLRIYETTMNHWHNNK